MLEGEVIVFFFQAEDGIRDLVRSRGLGDVYKRQGAELYRQRVEPVQLGDLETQGQVGPEPLVPVVGLSLIHI